MMRPAEVVRRGADYLARHGVGEPQASAERLMMAVLGTDRGGVYARREGLSGAEARRYGRMLCRRCAGVPVQHLTGETGFRRLVLAVRPGVFVPRPETEVVAGVALDAIADVPSPLVVDVGTGTGAIALAIAEERPDARVVATDRSAAAVALARDNAARLGLDVEVLEGDLLAPLPAGRRGEVDLVVSNPPYLDPAGLDALPPEVRADPAEALFGGLDGYERLFADARAAARPGAAVVVEVDPSIARDVAAAAAAAGLVDVAVHPDLTDRERVVAARTRPAR